MDQRLGVTDTGKKSFPLSPSWPWKLELGCPALRAIVCACAGVRACAGVCCLHQNRRKKMSYIRGGMLAGRAPLASDITRQHSYSSSSASNSSFAQERTYERASPGLLMRQNGDRQRMSHNNLVNFLEMIQCDGLFPLGELCH